MPTTAPSSPSPGNTVSLPSGFTPLPGSTPWQSALLALVGAPGTPGNYAFLNGWFAREHSATDIRNGTVYGNNPFFTTAGAGGTVGTLHAGEYPSINSQGVASYPSLSVGVFANALHIKTEYPHILAALKSGNPQAYAQGADGQNFSQDLYRWSGHGYTGFGSGQAAPTGPAIGSSLPSGILTMGDTGISSTNYPGQSVVQPIISGVKTTENLLQDLGNPALWLRIAEIVGGVMLVGLALYLIAKDMGLSPPKPPGPAGTVADEAAELAAAFAVGERQGRAQQARTAGRRSAGVVVTGQETGRSQRYSRIRAEAANIPDEVPF